MSSGLGCLFILGGWDSLKAIINNFATLSRVGWLVSLGLQTIEWQTLIGSPNYLEDLDFMENVKSTL